MSEGRIQFQRRDSTPESSSSKLSLHVLVVNDSQAMASEMTLQLELSVPGCKITYLPTIGLAKSILAKKAFHLVISSPILPDGPATELTQSLTEAPNQPDIVIVGNVSAPSVKSFEQVGYHLSAVRRRGIETDSVSEKLQIPLPLPPEDKPVQKIKVLGEDIRNDLNNPLQEIVTMVFVAKSESIRSELTEHALEAIQQAATNMAEYVRAIESRILKVVEPALGSH